MGLDMYLSKKTYIGANFEHRNVTGAVVIQANGKLVPIQLNRISYIEEQVGYWRKANAIHQWFVENCQDGVDECQHTYIPNEALEKLLAVCQEVKANPSRASELLPTQSGFFFGGTGYDEWYMQDIKDTIKILKDVLKEIKTQGEKYGVSYYYHASW